MRDSRSIQKSWLQELCAWFNSAALHSLIQGLVSSLVRCARQVTLPANRSGHGFLSKAPILGSQTYWDRSLGQAERFIEEPFRPALRKYRVAPRLGTEQVRRRLLAGLDPAMPGIRERREWC